MTQLEIELAVRGTITSVPEVEDRKPRPAAQPTADGEQGTLPGTSPEGHFRTSETLGPKLRLQTEYYLRQLEQRGTDWLLDEEARQWLGDLEMVRIHYRDIETEWFERGNGGSEDGLYAEVIERIVGPRAKAAYEGRPLKALDELFDPHCLVMDELSGEIPESPKDKTAARRAAAPTRNRAKVAVARARCFDRHPEWRYELECRLS